MKYSEYRSNIRTGDLLVWTHRGWSSIRGITLSMIRLFTMSEYTHVGVALVVSGRVFVVEAVSPYVRMVPLSTQVPCYTIPMDLAINNLVVEDILNMVGTSRYSYLEAIKSLFNKNKRSDKSWQCVEFAKEIYSKSGIDIDSKDTPSELVRVLQEKGKSIIFLEKD